MYAKVFFEGWCVAQQTLYNVCKRCIVSNNLSRDVIEFPQFDFLSWQNGLKVNNNEVADAQ